MTRRDEGLRLSKDDIDGIWIIVGLIVFGSGLLGFWLGGFK